MERQKFMEFPILDWLAWVLACHFPEEEKIKIIVLLQNYLHALKHEIIKYNIYVKYDPPMPPNPYPNQLISMYFC